MQLSRRAALGAGAATLALGRRARAQTAPIRIGLLTDFSGPYRDINGPTSVACLAQAVAEFTAANPDIKVETISADHQNKPDVAVSILRSWFDESGIDMVLNVTNSAVALAATSIITDKDKVCINTSAGSSVLTGPSCSRNLVHWTYDTWNLSHSSTTQVIKLGGKTWFFVTPNYAYGKALQADATKFIEASGGKVVGATIFPFPETTDFSSFIVQAAGSNAQVVVFAIGGTDEVNFIKQAQEFGLPKKARVVGMTGFITDVISMGLPVAQGLLITENFYWDLQRSHPRLLRPRQAAARRGRVSQHAPGRRLCRHAALPEDREDARPTACQGIGTRGGGCDEAHAHRRRLLRSGIDPRGRPQAASRLSVAGQEPG